MDAQTEIGLFLTGTAAAGRVGGRRFGANAAIRSPRARRRMAEKLRRSAARRFQRMTGIKLPAELDGRSFHEGDYEKIAAFVTANPAAKTLTDAFGEIDAEWIGDDC